MISIDTNILVRVFLKDDPEQYERATRIIHNGIEDGGVFISSYVLLEFFWVLKVNKFKRNEICNAVYTLIGSTGVHLGQKEIIFEALELYQVGKADFGDYLMYLESKSYGASNIKTFDKIFQKFLEK